MEIHNLILLGGVVLLGIVFYYLILPRLTKKKQADSIVKAVLFLGMISYLAYDFYMKGKYWYILILAGGSIAFLMLLFSRKNEE